MDVATHCCFDSPSPKYPQLAAGMNGWANRGEALQSEAGLATA